MFLKYVSLCHECLGTLNYLLGISCIEVHSDRVCYSWVAGSPFWRKDWYSASRVTDSARHGDIVAWSVSSNLTW